MEIVDVSPTTAYVRLALEFYNGHQCALSGIADRKGATLVYRGMSSVGDEPCVLTLRTTGGKVMLSDKEGVCRRNACGARGSFEGVSFPVSARRPIRYMARLKASSQYKQAVAVYAKR